MVGRLEGGTMGERFRYGERRECRGGEGVWKGIKTLKKSGKAVWEPTIL